MHRKRFFLCFALLSALLLLVVGAAAQDEETAHVRFLHGIPAASAVDIYTDGQLTVSNLSFGEATGYIQLPGGEHTLIVTPTGVTTPLWQQNILAEAGSAKTLVAAASDPLAFLIYEEDLVPLAEGNTRLLVVHAIPDGAPVDVLLARGDRIIENLQPGQPFGPFDVATFVYDLAVVPAGGTLDEAVVPVAPYALNAGTSHLLVIYGAANSPSATLLSSPTNASDTTAGFVRIVHAVPETSAVEVLLNDALVAPALSFGEATEHLALPAGSYQALIRAGGEVLATGTVTVEEGAASTVVAFGTADDVTLNVYSDDVAAITADQALLSVINAIPGDSTVSLALEDGTILADDLASGEASDVISTDPTQGIPNGAVTVNGSSVAVDLPVETLYGGVYYNVIALAGSGFSSPTFVFLPTTLAQGIASAPGAESAAIVAAATEVPPTVAPTAIPTETTPAPTEETQSAQATPVPAQPTNVPPPAPTETPAGPTARVNVNPDANLQLRQYPSADAFSLGVAPSGTILIVNGREGAPVFPEGVTPDPEEEEFVDPATLLTDEDEDLDPQQTWLNITYNTPDGGSITAWVNAYYVLVYNQRGELQRLADLPMVPNNQPGEAVATSLTPPPIPRDRVTATVYNLNPGVSLNIRRTPETTGERLEGVPSGTVLELLGLGESGDWAFIRYLPTGGGSITGWVSTLYIQYGYNGRTVDLEELDQRGLLVIIDDSLENLSDEFRGEISSGTETSALPTPDPIKDAFVATADVNPDVSLNLRRNPDENAEVIGKIPAGGQVIVTGRTGDSEWLQTSFEGQDGWIASAFVRITFNGQSAAVADIPLAAGETDTTG